MNTNKEQQLRQLLQSSEKLSTADHHRLEQVRRKALNGQASQQAASAQPKSLPWIPTAIAASVLFVLMLSYQPIERQPEANADFSLLFIEVAEEQFMQQETLQEFMQFSEEPEFYSWLASVDDI